VVEETTIGGFSQQYALLEYNSNVILKSVLVSTGRWNNNDGSTNYTHRYMMLKDTFGSFIIVNLSTKTRCWQMVSNHLLVPILSI